MLKLVTQRLSLKQALSLAKIFSLKPKIFLRKFQNQAELVHLKVLHKNILVVNSPVIAKAILKSEKCTKLKMIFNQLLPITGPQGLVQLEGAAWTEQFKLCNPFFSYSALSSLLPILQNNLASIADSSRESRVEIHTQLMAYTIKNILTILGFENLADIQALTDCFLTLNERCGQRMRMFLKLPLFVPTRNNRIIQQCQTKLSIIINQLLEQSSIREGSWLQHNKSTMQQAQLCDHIKTFIFAGFETTASSISFAVSRLASASDEQHKLFSEATHAISSVAELKNAAYTQAFYKEVLRLFPPAYMLVRQTSETIKLEQTTIPANSIIIINVYGMHRNPNYWHKPLSFNASRFLDTGSTQSAFMPFGHGPRICTGNSLAMLEAILCLQYLVKNFTISADSDIKPQTQSLVTLHPRDAIWMTLTPN